MSSTVGTLLTIDDVLTEGADDQYVEVDLVNPATDAAINTASIVSIPGTRTARDTGTALFSAANLVSTGRSSYPGTAGRVRITFTPADMAAVGTRERQRRELTLVIVHSSTKVFHCAVRFGLVNLSAVG
jgi:hypothetical protein